MPGVFSGIESTAPVAGFLSGSGDGVKPNRDSIFKRTDGSRSGPPICEAAKTFGSAALRDVGWRGHFLKVNGLVRGLGF